MTVIKWKDNAKLPSILCLNVRSLAGTQPIMTRLLACKYEIGLRDILSLTKIAQREKIGGFMWSPGI
jgi:hypothetical protein